MGILSRFLDEQNRSFDVTKIATAEFFALDQATPPNSVFKYFPKERVEFFARPAFRFSQRAALNDPFELTKRWRQFGSDATKKLFADHLKSTFRSLSCESEIVLEMAKNESLKRGRFLGDQEIANVREKLRTKEGKKEVRRILSDSIASIDAFVELMFSAANVGSGSYLEQFAAEFGIFSVSETGSNQQLWGLYASSGAGYCVELDTDHQFFRAPNGKKLIWKVSYTDQIQEGFLCNPMAMFLFKDQQWQFEREWRSLDNLENCDAAVGPNGDIHLKYVPRGLIKAITFGYSYDESRLAYDAVTLRYFDDTIKIRKAFVDKESREIVSIDLL
jgi:hypothetical protein